MQSRIDMAIKQKLRGLGVEEYDERFFQCTRLRSELQPGETRVRCMRMQS